MASCEYASRMKAGPSRGGAGRPENRVTATSKAPQKKWTGLHLPMNAGSTFRILPRVIGSAGQAFPLSASILNERIIRVAVQPAFTLFSRGDHRMAAAPGVRARVAIGRGVTTPRPAAGLTRSQMHPLRSHLHALLTHARSGRRDRVHRVDVRAATPIGSHQRSFTFTLSASLDT